MSGFVDSQKLNKTFKEDFGQMQKTEGANDIDDDFEEKKIVLS